MHELAVTQSILDIALRYAGAEQARRITDLYLVIGDLSSIVDDSVQFYWDFISRDTLAEGATLHFERIATEMTCADCGQVYHPAAGTLACPICHSARVQVTGGDEFRLDSIAVEFD